MQHHHRETHRFCRSLSRSSRTAGTDGNVHIVMGYAVALAVTMRLAVQESGGRLDMRGRPIKL